MKAITFEIQQSFCSTNDEERRQKVEEKLDRYLKRCLEEVRFCSQERVSRDAT